MVRWLWCSATTLVLFFTAPFPLLAQNPTDPAADSLRTDFSPYDPFGPANAPDHTGQGSGGVLTPSPYESHIQSSYTSINADAYGVEFMLDSPLQVAIGGGWSAYVDRGFGVLGKIRTSGFREWVYDPLKDGNVLRYILAADGSFEYPVGERGFRAMRVAVHGIVRPKGLSMAGIGVITSEWNLRVAVDRPMGRKLETEATWMQVSGGYIMPLSPRKGGVNLALCGAVDLLGVKYQSYFAPVGWFLGAKLGSIGWVFGFGWNANSLVNLGISLGGEWGFSTGALVVPSGKIVFADIARTTIHCGLQATGRWVNITGGIQKEWEYVDFQSREVSDKALRYYLGANVYFKR